MASNNRISSYTQSSDHDRPKSSDAKNNMWSSMLNSVSSGKKLPEKNILVLGMFTIWRRRASTYIFIGGNTESQREFLEALSLDESRKPQDRQSSKQPPIANNFALGYTYQDVLDADHEGTADVRSIEVVLITSRYPSPTLHISPCRSFSVSHTFAPTTLNPRNHFKYAYSSAP